jgi:hypothetical protein
MARHRTPPTSRARLTFQMKAESRIVGHCQPQIPLQYAVKILETRTSGISWLSFDDMIGCSISYGRRWQHIVACC